MAPKKAFQEPPPEEVEMEDPEYDEEDEDEDEDYIEGMDMGSMLAPFLTTEEGDNVCTALVTIGEHLSNLNKHMDNQNKILIKILSQLTKKDA